MHIQKEETTLSTSDLIEWVVIFIKITYFSGFENCWRHLAQDNLSTQLKIFLIVFKHCIGERLHNIPLTVISDIITVYKKQKTTPNIKCHLLSSVFIVWKLCAWSLLLYKISVISPLTNFSAIICLKHENGTLHLLHASTAIQPTPQSFVLER